MLPGIDAVMLAILPTLNSNLSKRQSMAVTTINTYHSPIRSQNTFATTTPPINIEIANAPLYYTSIHPSLASSPLVPSSAPQPVTFVQPKSMSNHSPMGSNVPVLPTYSAPTVRVNRTAPAHSPYHSAAQPNVSKGRPPGGSRVANAAAVAGIVKRTTGVTLTHDGIRMIDLWDL